MIFEVTDYAGGGTYCNLHIRWVDPLEYKCYVKKKDLGAVIEYILKNQTEIYKELVKIKEKLDNVVPHTPPAN